MGNRFERVLLVAAVCASVLGAVMPSIAVAAPTATSLASSAWPMLGHDLRHTFTSSVAGPETSMRKWEYSTGDYETLPPVIAEDGTIYVAGYMRLYALNPDGTLKWRHTGKGRLVGSPALGSDGTIYIGSTDGDLYAIDPNGVEKWAFETALPVVTCPAIAADGTIYVGSYDGHFYAVNPDGTKKWDFMTRGQITSSAAIDASGTIYFGSADGSLYAIDATGAQKWTFSTAGPVSGSPIIGGDGTIFFGGGDGHFYALTPQGVRKWDAITGGGSYGYPFPYPGPIYIGYGAASVSGAATATPGVLTVVDKSGKLVALTPDGTKLWSFSDPNVYFYGGGSTAMDANGVVYAGTRNGRLFAISAGGTKKWSTLVDTSTYGGYYTVSAPAIGADGTLYVTAGGKVVAIGGTPTSVSIAVNRSRLYLRKSVTLSGAVTPGLAGDRFAIDLRLPGSTRWSYASTRLASTAVGGRASWSYVYTPRKRGFYYFRARFLGDAVNASSISPSARVRVQ
jgi:outer membrane protein assembly factor BamB